MQVKFLINTYEFKKYLGSFKLVVYEGFSTNTVYRFLTNNFKLETLTVVELYRVGWQFESFFNWDMAASAYKDILRT